MTKTEYRKYIQSESWQQRRKVYLLEYNDCNRCELPRWIAILAYDNDLHVHHRNYQNVGSELDDDLEALCRRCHELETFGKSTLVAPWRELCLSCEETYVYDRYAESICDGCMEVRAYMRGASHAERNRKQQKGE